MDERDRDGDGRARNARPRDATGRPLPRDATGVDRLPEERVLDADETLREAQRLLDEDLPFQAHEVLEGAWKLARDPERALWQGLAQLAVGLTHAQRGNATGAAALLERGSERITGFATEGPYDIDIAGLVAHAGTLVARIREDGLAGVRPADRHPRLRR